jgi:hypothetical protein
LGRIEKAYPTLKASNHLLLVRGLLSLLSFPGFRRPKEQVSLGGDKVGQKNRAKGVY